MYSNIVAYIKQLFGNKEIIPLHEPCFIGKEKQYLSECVDSTFVSSVGKFVDRFEAMVSEYTGAKRAIACVNGTNALHLALLLVGVKDNDEVITQPLTFIATVNAISYANAHPVFIDVDMDTMGLSALKMEKWLAENAELRNNECYNKTSNRRIKACVPMHTFGHPVKLDELVILCKKYNIELVEDAAESIGSRYKGRHTGTFGRVGVLSFNGNKTITTGGGGMLLTNDDDLAKLAKHLTTQAKIPHKWEFVHDQIGYNYRMPNLNAALGCAQMEQLDLFIEKKRELASMYSKFFKDIGIDFVSEPKDSCSNYWLNTLVFAKKEEQQHFIIYTNEHGVMTRPAWRLMNKLTMFKDYKRSDLSNAEHLEMRVVNIPSSVII